ncbi:MAG: hypothetical protein H7X99_10750 [Saprospiraceae bacterium]|nr:hypothetical protein [Saprospiraceae bacterium]
MIKYLVMLAIGYYVYQHYFVPKQIKEKSKTPQNTENKNQEDYVDYEEVE